MLTSWGVDPCNRPADFVGVRILGKPPDAFVAKHAPAMLAHIDGEVCDGVEHGFHESYAPLRLHS